MPSEKTDMKLKMYSPVWNLECYKWSKEYLAADSQCTHNLQEKKWETKKKGFQDDVHTY